MKSKSILITSIFVLAALLVNAQGRSYHFGLHCSPSISWIKPDVEEIKYEGDGSSVGVSYGGIFEYLFTPNVGLMTGMNVIHTGGRLVYPYVNENLHTDTGTLWRKYKLQYIEIPFSLKGSTGELLGKFSFYGNFGIGSAVNIKAKADDEYLSDASTTGEKVVTSNRNVNKSVSFFRESLIIGIGAEYRLGKTAIARMGLTFSNGFTDILTDDISVKPELEEKARSNYLELNIAILF